MIYKLPISVNGRMISSNLRGFYFYKTSHMRSTVNVLKVRTLKNNYFSAVRNFRNYVSEKVLVFVILECGLYHGQKRYICM